MLHWDEVRCLSSATCLIGGHNDVQYSATWVLYALNCTWWHWNNTQTGPIMSSHFGNLLLVVLLMMMKRVLTVFCFPSHEASGLWRTLDNLHRIVTNLSSTLCVLSAASHKVSCRCDPKNPLNADLERDHWSITATPIRPNKPTTPTTPFW